MDAHKVIRTHGWADDGEDPPRFYDEKVAFCRGQAAGRREAWGLKLRKPPRG